MNTYQAGKSFEDKFYELIRDELENERLPFKSKYCKLYKQKGYYSKDRESEIKIDISIEINFPNQLFLLVAFECKNYNHRIPVNDIEEFDSKLRQIEGLNVKGIFVSSSSFQKGAYNFAKNKRIGLIRLLNDNKLKWELSRTVSLFTNEKANINYEHIEEILTTDEFIHDYINFYAIWDKQYSINFNHYLFTLIKDSIPKNFFSLHKEIKNKNTTNGTVPFIPEEDIENETLKILKGIDYNGSAVSLDTICENLIKDNRLNFYYKDSIGHDHLGYEILGKISFDPTEIIIAKDIQSSSFRQRFTIAHELGHFFLLHNKFIKNEYYSEIDYKNNEEYLIPNSNIKKLETQANIFASQLLMPKLHFIKKFFELLKKENMKNRGFGFLYVDNQQGNYNKFLIITNSLRNHFYVSRKAVIIRLKELNLINEESDNNLNISLRQTKNKINDWF